MRITLDQMKDAIKKHVNKEPRRIYDSEFGCFYWENEAPSCLIGCALYTLNVPKEILQRLDCLGGQWGNLPACINDEEAKKILEKSGFVLDKDAVEFAMWCQENQDSGVEWKKSYDYAEESMKDEKNNIK